LPTILPIVLGLINADSLFNINSAPPLALTC
jgi:hypothetical protein